MDQLFGEVKKYYYQAMEARIEGPHYEGEKRMYWGEIYFKDTNSKSAVLVSASRHYLDDMDSTGTPEEKFRSLMNIVLEKWKNSGDVLSEPKHYEVFSMTPEGRENGIGFLEGVTLDN